jgi:hypothetical protein
MRMNLVFQDTGKTVSEKENLTITATIGGTEVVTARLRLLMEVHAGIGIHNMNAVNMENVIGNENDKETGNATTGMEDILSDPHEDARPRRESAPPGPVHPLEIILRIQRK